MSEAAIVLLVVFCLVGCAFLLIHQRHIAMAKECIDNLRCIDGAKETWALENYSSTNHGPASYIESDSGWDYAFSNDVPTAKDVALYMYFPDATGARAMPRCPQGGTYTIGHIRDVPTCSIPTHRLPPGISFRLSVEDESGKFISAAFVEAIDDAGNHIGGFTDGRGTVDLIGQSTVVAVIISKNGYNTISNSLPLSSNLFGRTGIRLKKNKS